MKLEEIEREWAADADINPLKLDSESLKIPKLHSKYYSILMKEKMLLMKLKNDLESLEYVLERYYAKTLTEEEMKEYNLVECDKKYIKQEIPRAVANRSEIINLKTKIGVQHMKIEFVEAVIKMILNRNFAIRDAIEWRKFVEGN